MQDDARRLQERRQRFAREARQPPPAAPVKRLAYACRSRPPNSVPYPACFLAPRAFARPVLIETRLRSHPGGKIVTSDKDACFLKLIARKQAASEELNEDQRRVLSSLTNGGGDTAPRAKPAPAKAAAAAPKAPLRAPAEAPAPAVSERSLLPAASKRIRTLRKKLHDIEELERRAADGAILQENQKTKIQAKAEVQAELKRLEAES